MVEIFAWLVFCLQLLSLLVHMVWGGIEWRGLL